MSAVGDDGGVIVFAEVVGAWIVYSLFDGVWDQSSLVLDLAAVAAIVGSVAAYNRLRAALTASEATGKAWHEERDASVARAERIEGELKTCQAEGLALVAKVVALEQRPDLSKLEALVSESTESMKRHEVAAAQRTDRLINAVEALPHAIGYPSAVPVRHTEEEDGE